MKKSGYVYSEIKKMIISGELPPLSDISEDTLSKRFNTSRTPVHEAVLRLAEEGFIIVYPRKLNTVPCAIQ